MRPYMRHTALWSVCRKLMSGAVTDPDARVTHRMASGGQGSGTTTGDGIVGAAAVYKLPLRRYKKSEGMGRKRRPAGRL